MDRHFERPKTRDISSMVVKIGTTVLIDDRTNEIKHDTLARICRDLAEFKRTRDSDGQKGPGVSITVGAHPQSILAGAIGAGLWGAFRHERLAAAAG